MAGAEEAGATSPADRILSEGPIGMAAAAGMLGSFRDGRPTHPSTISRWATAGIRINDGSTLRLEAVRINGRLATSRAALVRFINAQQLQTTDGPAIPSLRSPHARVSASARAEAELIAAGC